MLAMGRALMSQPKLLLLDEPSMGLAPIFIQEILILSKIFKTRNNCPLIEQNANKALAIADRGYVLETGKVVLSGTGKELLASEEVKKHIWVAKMRLTPHFRLEIGTVGRQSFLYSFLGPFRLEMRTAGKRFSL